MGGRGGRRAGAGRPTEVPDSVKTSLDLPREDAEWLRAEAERRGVSASAVTRAAIERARTAHIPVSLACDHRGALSWHRHPDGYSYLACDACDEPTFPPIRRAAGGLCECVTPDCPCRRPLRADSSGCIGAAGPDGVCSDCRDWAEPANPGRAERMRGIEDRVRALSSTPSKRCGECGYTVVRGRCECNLAHLADRGDRREE